MKKLSLNLVGWILAFTLFIPVITFAGNKQRAGQAGASDLLINPWARSSGWGGANSASVRGLEALQLNIAGTAFTNKTELIFSRVDLMSGADIAINSFGFSQKVGETGVLSMALMSTNFGEIMKTTTELPEGGIGNYNPQYNNISIAYSKAFSNSIYGGIVVKVITQGISNASASGIALDAGIQYVTGKNEQIKFGMSMKNVGPTMMFTGDGMSSRGFLSNNVEQTLQVRSQDYELPSLIMIGGAYDFTLSSEHTLQAAGTFISNSFTKDQFALGMEYSFKKILMLRGGYVYEQGLLVNTDDRTTAYTGPTAGVSVEIPLNKEEGSTFAIDYSYRATNPFNGVHSIGAKVTL